MRTSSKEKSRRFCVLTRKATLSRIIIQNARKEHAKRDQARQLNAFFKIEPEKGFSYVGPHQGFDTGNLLDAINQRTEADMNR